MLPAQPSAEAQPSCDDDEPTLIFKRPPASFAGMAIPVGSPPVSVPKVAPRRTMGRKLLLGVGLASALSLGGLACLGLGADALHLDGTALDLRGTALDLRSAALELGAAALDVGASPAARPARAAASLGSQVASLLPRVKVEPAAPAIAPEDRADATLDRLAIMLIPDGIITLPSSFSSPDGAYDLVVHFHGVNDVVKAGFERAGLNAAIMIVNLGISSAAYESKFSARSYLPALLARAQASLEARGLRGARLRRLALSAFSAGYGAVRALLNQPAVADQVDAVLLLDGIHTGYLYDRSLDLTRLAPFTRLAEQAASGEKLFSITHSEIVPIGDYASTHESSDALLSITGAQRTPGAPPPPVAGPASAATEAPRPAPVPLSEAHKGAFHVRGYAGTQKPDHVMHLARMGDTAVPDLVRRWSDPAQR